MAHRQSTTQKTARGAARRDLEGFCAEIRADAIEMGE